MKEGNDTTRSKFHTVKGTIDALVTKDDTHEISSAISTITEKCIGATLPSSTKTRKITTPVAAASPYNKAKSPEVACTTLFDPMLQPTVTEVHMAAASPKISAHIPQPTGISGSNVPDQELLRRPTFINDDYDETVDKLWDDWYKKGINLIMQDRKVSEKWRTEWSVKDNKKFSHEKTVRGEGVEYTRAQTEGQNQAGRGGGIL
jgi:hypothetical protein